MVLPEGDAAEVERIPQLVAALLLVAAIGILVSALIATRPVTDAAAGSSLSQEE